MVKFLDGSNDIKRSCAAWEKATKWKSCHCQSRKYPAAGQSPRGQAATPAQEAELDKIIQEMESIQSSATEDEALSMTFNSGGGPQTNNVNHGSGQQINNNASIGTQNIIPGKD